jgi:hypothetical protein
LASLNLAANNLGQLVLPEGWSGLDDGGEYKDPGGEKHQQAPAGSKPEGIIVLANAIKDMGALTSLDISSNNIGAYWDGRQWIATPEGTLAQPTTTFVPHTSVYVGPAAIADAIKAMEALTKLGISNNNIEQGEVLQGIADFCNTKGIELDNHESESESESGSDSDGDF